MKCLLAILILLSPHFSRADTFAWAKERYAARDLDAFFGSVQWIRAREWPRLAPADKDRWLALELLALARLCAWPAIEARASFEPLPGPLSKEAMSYIELKEGFKRYKLDPESLRPTLANRLITSRSRWAATTQDFARFSSPENLKVHVSSRCDR